MIADPLVKAKSCERLAKKLATGALDSNPTTESVHINQKSKEMGNNVGDATEPRGAAPEKPGGEDIIPEEAGEVHVADADASGTTRRQLVYCRQGRWGSEAECLR